MESSMAQTLGSSFGAITSGGRCSSRGTARPELGSLAIDPLPRTWADWCKLSNVILKACLTMDRLAALTLVSLHDGTTRALAGAPFSWLVDGPAGKRDARTPLVPMARWHV